MSVEFYKILHLLAAFMVLISLGGLATHAANGGGRDSNKVRAPLSVLHGLGLVISLVAGFGLIAKVGTGFPIWVIMKLVIWLILGIALMIPNRAPQYARLLLWLLPVLGGIAAWLAIAKPFL